MLNAVVADRFDRAREEARAAEVAYSKGVKGLPPLLGVPCTVKEFVAVQGMPHTAGLKVRAGVRADRDAPVVQRLRQAGAVVLGSTNGPEGGLWHETHNLVYGRTSNPHDLSRSPGGSSGGEGAIIAAGGSPFGLGSDVGGSVRLPAAFCGIFGHKPTHRRVPVTGHHPPGPPNGHYLAIGPMTRSARDLPLLMSVLEGVTADDPDVVAWPSFDVHAVQPRTIKVWALEGNGRASVRPAVAQGVRDAASALNDRGCSVQTPVIPELSLAFEIWAELLASSGSGYDEIVTGGGRVRLREQLPRWARGQADHTGAVLTMVLLERAIARLPSRAASIRAALASLRARIDGLLGDDGVLLLPVFARQAPRHRTIGVGNPTDVGLTAVFNILELPATSVPIGRTPDGLPRAVQVVARRGQDHLCLAVAAWLEDAFGSFEAVEPHYGRPSRIPYSLWRPAVRDRAP